MKISHTIITWVPFSHAPAGKDQKFLVSMANFKNGHLKKRVVDLVKMVDRGVVDLMKIRRFGSNH